MPFYQRAGSRLGHWLGFGNAAPPPICPEYPVLRFPLLRACGSKSLEASTVRFRGACHSPKPQPLSTSRRRRLDAECAPRNGMANVSQSEWSVCPFSHVRRPLLERVCYHISHQYAEPGSSQQFPCSCACPGCHVICDGSALQGMVSVRPISETNARDSCPFSEQQISSLTALIQVQEGGTPKPYDTHIVQEPEFRPLSEHVSPDQHWLWQLLLLCPFLVSPLERSDEPSFQPNRRRMQHLSPVSCHSVRGCVIPLNIINFSSPCGARKLPRSPPR